MRIKIGNVWIDAKDTWLAVELTQEEVECLAQIRDNGQNLGRFCAGDVHEEQEVEALRAWMNAE